MQILENPLVTILVITYNSSKYVLETLESTKAQTYQNIELIVSDDFSTDNTVKICQAWIESNKKRFVRTELITVEKNTGIAPNCNRGVKVAQGDWLKLIAGDDILLQNCVKENINYILTNNEISVLFSKLQPFKTKEYEKILQQENSTYYSCFNLSTALQYKSLLKINFIYSPTLFAKTSLLKENLFDENYPYLEDYPEWLKLSKKGIKFYFLNSYTVLYRIGDSTLRPSETFYNIHYMECLRSLYYNEIKLKLTELDVKSTKSWEISFLEYDFCRLVLNNHKTFFSEIIYKFIHRILIKYIN